MYDLTRHRRRPDDPVHTATSALLDGVVGESFAARRFELTVERAPVLEAALWRLATDDAQTAWTESLDRARRLVAGVRTTVA